MPNLNANAPYDQIPHIVINHPDTNSEHKEIMRVLYNILKNKFKPIIYANSTLSIDCRIPLRTVERRMSELVKMGFIHCTGKGYNRRILLGYLFANSAIVADKSWTTPPKSISTTAKTDIHNRHPGGDNKNNNKNNNKCNFSTSYSVSFNHPSDRGDKSLITPNSSFNHPKLKGLMTPMVGIPIDNIKNNNKDNGEVHSCSFLNQKIIQDYEEYVSIFNSDKRLGFIERNQEYLTFEEWKKRK